MVLKTYFWSVLQTNQLVLTLQISNAIKNIQKILYSVAGYCKPVG